MSWSLAFIGFQADPFNDGNMASVEKVTELELGQFHSAVEVAFSEGLKVPVSIRRVDETLDWIGALPKTPVFFAARPADNRAKAEVLPDRSMGFEFTDGTAHIPLWVSWREEWVKAIPARGRRRPAPTLHLVGVSTCFYVGNTARQKTQILRAEWDNPAHRGNNAAQPHWHVDPDLIDLPSWSPEPRFEMPHGLTELPASEGPQLSPETCFWRVRRLHLGMAGWTHHTDSPQCWQHTIQLSVITGWLKRVLLYCGRELPRVTMVH